MGVDGRRCCAIPRMSAREKFRLSDHSADSGLFNFCSEIRNEKIYCRAQGRLQLIIDNRTKKLRKM
jgi:hypothetical protein